MERAPIVVPPEHLDMGEAGQSTPHEGAIKQRSAPTIHVRRCGALCGGASAPLLFTTGRDMRRPAHTFCHPSPFLEQRSRDGGWSAAKKPGEGADMRPLPLLMRCPYGVGSEYDPPKMSLLPNVAGQSCWGAGRVGSDASPTAVPLTMSWR